MLRKQWDVRTAGFKFNAQFKKADKNQREFLFVDLQPGAMCDWWVEVKGQQQLEMSVLHNIFQP